jgi:hypothetical protein
MPEQQHGFQATQRAFSAYIRDPQRNPLPADVKPERMHMYRELFYNNVSGFLENGFPVLHSLLDSAAWQSLVEDFFARHLSRTPLFTGIPEEFLDYLHNERAACSADPPFLLELAHYEWVELALAIAEAEPPRPQPARERDPLAQTLVLSPLAWPLAYRFPVHRISSDFQPETPPDAPTCLAVYRDRNDQVHFVETNPPTHRLLLILRDRGPIAAMDCMTLIANELGQSSPERLLAHGAELLRDLMGRSVVGAL